MRLFRKIYHYLNPIVHLGDHRHSFFFPFIANLILCVSSEVFAYGIARNPLIIGEYIIFFNAAFVIYFAFRDGIEGGVISTVIAVAYYFYIMVTRHYTGVQLVSGTVTTLILGAIFLLIAIIIGWLKQVIDALIEREANERVRLLTILQQLPLGVLITNEKGLVVQTNKQVDEILGVKIPYGHRVGVDPPLINDIKHDEETNRVESPLYQVLHTGKAVYGKEYTLKKKDGKLAHIQLSASAVFNKQGKIIAAAEIINDITQQKEIEQRKDDFVNMASHELKTPVTSMKLYADVLMNRIKKYDDDKSIKTLNNMKQQMERLQKLVNDLLDISRLHTGKLSFNKEDFWIDDLVAETVEVMQVGNVPPKIIFDSPVHISVHADKFRIYQVLSNLLTNAIKYSSKKGDIIVQIKRQGKNVLIKVKDNGIGIEKSEQKKIFERFYRVSGDTEKTFPGLGMGLYISKQIIRGHKGTIGVESKIGKGSEFYFSLPIAKPIEGTRVSP